ncbi:MAG: VCBS repeat-containing protein, partial [Synergistaceae bacterium]|nr:VCBS repeat-containing protein [Synergistaceae bacterium]
MADFNGDGRQEIAVVYKGHNEDLPSGLDSALPNTVGPVYVKLYQYSATRNDKLIESKSAAKKSFTSYTRHKTYKDLMVLSDIGDIKAVAADVDGDGKSELV